jgi:hypothetical protein
MHLTFLEEISAEIDPTGPNARFPALHPEAKWHAPPRSEPALGSSEQHTSEQHACTNQALFN